MLSSLRLLPADKLEIPWSLSILIRDVRKPLPFSDASVSAVYFPTSSSIFTVKKASG